MQPCNNINSNSLERIKSSVNVHHIPTRLINLAAPLSRTRSHRKRKSLPTSYVPTGLDVVCGRGKKHWNHPGNIQFRNLIQSNVERYIAAPTKSDKTAVVVSLVDGIRAQGGYFLKQNSSSGKWSDIGDRQALDKVGHSLRDHVSSQARQKNKKKAIKLFKKKQTVDNSDAQSDSGRDREIRRATLSSSMIVDAFSRRPSFLSSSAGRKSMMVNQQNTNSYLEFVQGLYLMDELGDIAPSFEFKSGK
jgi:hypothetical protein